MELTQIEQLVRWLDEERKRDKLQLSALQERVEQQMQVIESQSVEIENLRQDLLAAQNDLRRTEQYQGMIEHLKRDFASQMDDLNTRLNRQLTEKVHMLNAQLSATGEKVGELEQKVRQLPQYEESLKSREAGEMRLLAQLQQLSNAYNDFVKRTEEQLQNIVYIEEQRRADARRVTTLEGEVPQLRKSHESLLAKLVWLEDSLRKLPPRIEDAVRIAKSYDPKIEELRVADFQREQRMKQYAEQAALVNAEMQRLVEQTQKYALLYAQNKQALEDLGAFRARLDKRLNEIAEMQRLTEERLKRQWETWQATFTRDWQKRMVTEEDRWRRQDLATQGIEQQIDEIGEQVKLYYHELVGLWEELLAMPERWQKSLQGVWTQNTETPTQRLKALRRFAEEKHKELL